MRDARRLLDLEYLVRLHERGVRDADGVFLIEGVRHVVTANDTGAEILSLVICRKLLRSRVGQMLARRHRARGLPVLTVSPEQFGRLSLLGEPQGIAAVVRQSWRPLPRPGKTRSGIWLCFEEVRSHGNLGTIIRSAQATGARGIIFLGDHVDPFAPRVVRPTMGAIFRQEMIRTTPEAFNRWKLRVRCSVIGTSAEARQEYRAIRYDGPTVIMMGSERKGLSETQRDLCDSFVRIPMRGGIDSLNFAVADQPGSLNRLDTTSSVFSIELSPIRRSTRCWNGS